MRKINKELKDTVDQKVEEILSELMNDRGITTGDVTLSQALTWDHVVGELTELFEEILKQNTIVEEEEVDEE